MCNFINSVNILVNWENHRKNVIFCQNNTECIRICQNKRENDEKITLFALLATKRRGKRPEKMRGLGFARFYNVKQADTRNHEFFEVSRPTRRDRYRILNNKAS